MNLTEIQLKTRQSYKTYKEFLQDYKPEQLLVLYDDISTVEKSVAGVRLTIDDVDKVYSSDQFSAGVNYLELWLDFVNRFSNINKPLVETRAVAFMIHNDYKHFHLADLKVIFKNLMIGEYGSFYGSVDAQRILTAFAQYASARRKAILETEKDLNRFIDGQFAMLYRYAEDRAFHDAKVNNYDYLQIAQARDKYRQEVDQDKQKKIEDYKAVFYEKLKEKLK